MSRWNFDKHDIQEVYREDTQGKKLHTPIQTKYVPPVKSEEKAEVHTYQTRKPMKWKEFKAMPKDLQVSYIEWLKSEYSVMTKTIAEELFHIHPEYLSMHTRKLGINSRYGKKRQSPTEEARWKKFLAGEAPATRKIYTAPASEFYVPDTATSVEVPNDPEFIPPVTPKPEQVIEQASPSSDICCKDIDVVFEGNVDDCMARLDKMVVALFPDKADVKISVTISSRKEGED